MAGLKLHITKDAIGSKEFRDSVDAFTKMLDALGHEVSSSSQWMLSVARGSIGILAEFLVDEAHGEDKIIFFDNIRSKLVDIAHGEADPSEPANREYLRLADAVDNGSGEETGAEIVAFDDGGNLEAKPLLKVTHPTKAAAKSPEEHSFGSVTGKVYSLNGLRGNRFQMIDESTNSVVKGTYESGMVHAMSSVFMQRATLAGEITYSNGKPKSIKARLVHKEPSRLPSLMSLRGILEG